MSLLQSVCSHPDEKLRQRTDEILSEEQAGFRSGRGTIDQIFTLRQIAEKYVEFGKDLYVCYIDFRKAFDSVWRDGLWSVMRHLGYPEKIVRILEDLYSETLSAVRVNGSITEWFETLVAESCRLAYYRHYCSTYFLKSYTIARALRNLDIGVVLGGYRLNNLCFADDIVAICNNNQGLDAIVTSMAMESRRMGLNINIDKTETQLIGRYPGPCDIKLEGQVLNQVEDFFYLGGLISSTGSSQPDVRRRIGLACDAVSRLAKIWKNKAISKATKVQVYETMVLSIIVLQLGNMDIDSKDKQTAKSF